MRVLIPRFVLTAAAASFAAAAAAQPVVQTDLGTLGGAIQDGSDVFRGIPYAAPPTGERRWRPPAEALPWRGVRPAVERAPDCPQIYSVGQEAYRGPSIQSEDCLYLNVWRPAGTRPGAKLPVMFWIHGGSFVAGSGSWSVYDGRTLNRDGVILVSINYRLGVLGRFAHPALVAEQRGGPLANYGLMDQIAALKWVRRNIGAFGGDPDNVTIFGYSAGGVSVNYLMTAPAARGLFHRAISQSGGIQVEGSRKLEEQGVERLREPLLPEGVRMAEALGARNMAALRALPVARLLEWQTRNLIGSLNPVEDGVLIPESVGAAFERGHIADVDYLAGSTNWEASLIAGAPIPPQAILAGVDDLSGVRAHYGAIGDRELAQAWFADNVFVGPPTWLGRRVARKRGASWIYHYAYLPEAVRGSMPGAAHGDEVPMIFGTLPGKIRGLAVDAVTPRDREVAGMMGRYWTNFAKSGNPNGPGLPLWPAATPYGEAALLIGETTTGQPAVHPELMRFLEGRYAKAVGE